MHDKLKRIELIDIPLLAEIPAPPKRMYMRGSLPSRETKWLSVVGSRAVTPYGKQVCEYLISGLRGYPITIVSGLAYGVDALAHKYALEAGLQCVAVPGSGLDWSVLYPRANVSLAKAIVEAGGALLSEYEPMQKAADYTFPQRNRVMVGMSHAVIVIEAKERSGSLITARLATEYNRDLLVVPGSIFSAQSKGTHQFLKLGATPVTEPADILKVLGLETRASEPQRTDISDAETRIFELLETPHTRDELTVLSNMPPSTLSETLTIMEIKGLIIEELGAVRRARGS